MKRGRCIREEDIPVWLSCYGTDDQRRDALRHAQSCVIPAQQNTTRMGGSNINMLEEARATRDITTSHTTFSSITSWMEQVRGRGGEKGEQANW